MYSQMPRRSLSGEQWTRAANHAPLRPDGRGVYVPLNYSGTAIGTATQPAPCREGASPQHQVADTSEEIADHVDAVSESYDLAPLQTACEENQPLSDQGKTRYFPFGHGLGFEELFLLGLLLFLIGESSEDNCEGHDLSLPLLLVGALLFCG